jgi:hypothetical protein
MAMFERMAAKNAAPQHAIGSPKVGSFVKSRHEWILHHQAKEFTSSDKAEQRSGEAASDCRNDRKLVTKTLQQKKEEEREPAELSPSEADPILVANQNSREAVSESAPQMLDEVIESPMVAPIPDICFCGEDSDSVVSPVDLSSLFNSDGDKELGVTAEAEVNADEEDAPADEAAAAAAIVTATETYFVKHNRSFTRVTVIENSSRGSTPVSHGSGADTSSSSSKSPPPTPVTADRALSTHGHDEAIVDESDLKTNQEDESDPMRVDRPAGENESPWFSETLLITKEEWESVAKIPEELESAVKVNNDIVWRETKKPIKWCLDSLLIDNTL